MALTPAQNQALIREIDDAVRQDDMRNFWTRYGLWVAGIVVVALVAFGGFLLWQDHSRKQADATGEQFARIIADAPTGKVDQAALQSLENASQPGYRAGALLTKAALSVERKDYKSAITTYGAIAADDGLSQPYRDLALVRQTALEFDSLPPQAVIDRLAPLAKADNAWFGSAGELTALAQIKLGKRDAAGKLFAEIASSRDVPRTIQTRAVQMASLLGVDATIAPRPGEVKEDAANAQ